MRIDGIRARPGFCVTTEAFQRSMVEAPSVAVLLDRLGYLAPDDHASIRTLSAEIRAVIEGVAIPHDLVRRERHESAHEPRHQPRPT